jgi:hypothetical protein
MLTGPHANCSSIVISIIIMVGPAPSSSEVRPLGSQPLVSLGPRTHMLDSTINMANDKNLSWMMDPVPDSRHY